MTKELALEITNNASRCTEATLRAFGIDAIPKFGSGVLGQLKENGFKCTPIKQPKYDLKRFKNWMDRYPSPGSKEYYNDNYLIYTKGHAMAVIEGHLIDTERKGWNSRRIEFIWRVEKI